MRVYLGFWMLLFIVIIFLFLIKGSLVEGFSAGSSRGAGPAAHTAAAAAATGSVRSAKNVRNKVSTTK